MSMNQANGKQTKGKQKIEMKKIEAYKERMSAFSKRKSGIYKMMNEIITLCGVEGAVLIFPQAEKPYSFANSSMEKVADKLKNHSRHELSAEDKINNTGHVVEACKNQMIENLFQKYTELSEELGMEKEKVKLLKESRNEKGIKKMWWNFTVANLTVEQIEQRHQAFVELRNNLCDMTFSLSGKDGDHSSSGSGSGHCGCGEA